jgi:diketogulonate reductase-like aldo/keto reductase
MYQASGKAVVHALKSGYLQLDCAKFYRNENDIGTGIKEAGVSREKIFVVTKLFSTDGGRESAINAVKESLELMKTDYIDQYLLHAPQGGKVLECYDVLLDYQKKGIIKTVGVSNFGVSHLEALKNSGRPLPQANQIELHPWCTNEDIVKWCNDHNVAVVGYSPLAQGKFLDDPFLIELSKKYNKSPGQILIRWALEKGFHTIPKSTKQERIVENANVFDLNSAFLPYQAVNIYFNAPLYGLFSSFPARYLGYGQPFGKDFRILVTDIGGTNISPLIPPQVAPPPLPAPQVFVNYLAIATFQETSTTSAITPIQAIVFTSTTLPVQASQVSTPVVLQNNQQLGFAGNNAASANIITDLISDTGIYQPNLVYLPSSQYRLVTLYGNSPLSNLDISVFYRLRNGSLVPFRLQSGGTLSMKISFLKKATYYGK